MTKIIANVPHLAGLYSASCVTKDYTTSVFRGSLESAQEWRKGQARREEVLTTAIRHSAQKVDSYVPGEAAPRTGERTESHAFAVHRYDIPPCAAPTTQLVSIALTTKDNQHLKNYCLYRRVRQRLMATLSDEELHGFYILSETDGPPFRKIYCSMDRNKVVDTFLDAKLEIDNGPDVEDIHLRRAFFVSTENDPTVLSSIIAASKTYLCKEFCGVESEEHIVAMHAGLTQNQRSEIACALLDATAGRLAWPRKSLEFDAPLVITSEEGVRRFESILEDWQSLVK